MTVPLSDSRLAEIRERVDVYQGIGPFAMAELMAMLLREVDRLRAELLGFTHPVVTCFGCHHIAPWHVGELGKTERPCTQCDCNCTDLVKEG